jgi:hypothetical protein
MRVKNDKNNVVGFVSVAGDPHVAASPAGVGRRLRNYVYGELGAIKATSIVDRKEWRKKAVQRNKMSNILIARQF